MPLVRHFEARMPPLQLICGAFNPFLWSTRHVLRCDRAWFGTVGRIASQQVLPLISFHVVTRPLWYFSRPPLCTDCCWAFWLMNLLACLKMWKGPMSFHCSSFCMPTTPALQSQRMLLSCLLRVRLLLPPSALTFRAVSRPSKLIPALMIFFNISWSSKA